MGKCPASCERKPLVVRLFSLAGLSFLYATVTGACSTSRLAHGAVGAGDLFRCGLRLLFHGFGFGLRRLHGGLCLCLRGLLGSLRFSLGGLFGGLFGGLCLALCGLRGGLGAHG